MGLLVMFLNFFLFFFFFEGLDNSTLLALLVSLEISIVEALADQLCY